MLLFEVGELVRFKYPLYLNKGPIKPLFNEQVYFDGYYHLNGDVGDNNKRPIFLIIGINHNIESSTNRIIKHYTLLFNNEVYTANSMQMKKNAVKINVVIEE
jgi:hypothetical protein